VVLQSANAPAVASGDMACRSISLRGSVNHGSTIKVLAGGAVACPVQEQATLVSIPMKEPFSSAQQ
jgi:hypothetical protein